MLSLALTCVVGWWRVHDGDAGNGDDEVRLMQDEREWCWQIMRLWISRISVAVKQVIPWLGSRLWLLDIRSGIQCHVVASRQSCFLIYSSLGIEVKAEEHVKAP